MIKCCRFTTTHKSIQIQDLFQRENWMYIYEHKILISSLLMQRNILLHLYYSIFIIFIERQLKKYINKHSLHQQTSLVWLVNEVLIVKPKSAQEKPNCLLLLDCNLSISLIMLYWSCKHSIDVTFNFNLFFNPSSYYLIFKCLPSIIWNIWNIYFFKKGFGYLYNFLILYANKYFMYKDIKDTPLVHLWVHLISIVENTFTFFTGISCILWNIHGGDLFLKQLLGSVWLEWFLNIRCIYLFFFLI